MKTAAKFAAVLLVLFLGVAAVRVASRAQSKPSEKGKGGYFGGVKPVAARGSQQQGLTATGGAKGVGEEGGAIGAVQPTSEHRAVISAMEIYSIPEPDLKRFQADGKLQPAK
jgi:hypothetical protein